MFSSIYKLYFEHFSVNFQIKGKDCNTDPYPDYTFLSNWIYFVDYVSFEVKKNDQQHDGYNKHIKIPHEDFIPDKLNDTFTFEIETKVEYHCKYIHIWLKL